MFKCYNAFVSWKGTNFAISGRIMDGEDMTVKARMLKLLEQHENELISEKRQQQN